MKSSSAAETHKRGWNWRTLLHPSILLSALLVDAITCGAFVVFCDFGKLTKPVESWLRLPPAMSAPEQKAHHTTGVSRKISGLGRLEPQGEMIKIAPPAIFKEDRVDKLLVCQGDFVSKGQIIAILNSRQRLESALREAKEKVKLNELKLVRVQAGAKAGEIRAQQEAIRELNEELSGRKRAQNAVIRKLKAEVAFAESELERYARLHREGAISRSVLDNKEMSAHAARASCDQAQAELTMLDETIKERIAQAEANLERIQEVRPIDVAVARAELEQSRAEASRIATDLQLCFVRAPHDGQVLRLNAREGEAVTDKGLVDFGQTAHMVAVAEIYQTDIRHIKAGQPAIITADGLSQPVHGKVWTVGLQVLRQDVYGTEPGANHDRRVLEVKVLIDKDDSARVAGLTNLQVEVAIDT